MLIHTLLNGLMLAVLLSTGCAIKESAKVESTEKILSIKVRNITPRTLYASCFTFMRKEESPRWRWYKTQVYELVPSKDIVMALGSFKSRRSIPDAYGVLGLFTEYEKAENAIYELLPDENKIDLDRVNKLADKTVVIGLEKYGIAGDIFEYSMIPDNSPIKDTAPLDFTVENQTGKPVYVTAFIYEKKEDMPIWQYNKSPIVRIETGELGAVKVDAVLNTYDRRYTRGYLGVFEESERQEAFDCTFPLLKDHQRIDVGVLAALKNGNIVLKKQKYGIMGDVVDFVPKDTRKIALTKSENIRYQPRYS